MAFTLSMQHLMLLGTDSIFFVTLPCFLQSNFNVEHFIMEYRRKVPVESLRNDLRMYLKILQSALVELINKDYADFVNLSTNLVCSTVWVDLLFVLWRYCYCNDWSKCIIWKPLSILSVAQLVRYLHFCCTKQCMYWYQNMWKVTMPVFMFCTVLYVCTFYLYDYI